jgi:methylated-DNA-[protein]-cysteine S-methyltransferase
MAMAYSSVTHTPLGYMRAVATDSGVCRMDWQQSPFTIQSNHIKAEENDVSRETISQLNAYLAAERKIFTIPLDLSAIASPFQKWLLVLKDVPYGDTISYADFAERWGNRKAARAAGSACRRNPLPIIVPCHRILKSDWSYDNYSGGNNKNPHHPDNIYIKQYLIEFEAQNQKKQVAS